MRRFCFIFFLGFGTLVKAQVVVNAPLYVGPDAIFFSGHAVDNTGLIFNQGLINLASHWKNTGTYQGNGTIYFSGITEQTFFHNGNPVSGIILDARRVIQSGRLPVQASFDLINGYWQSSSTDTLWFGNGIAVSGGASNSFIEGPLHHEGTGRKYYPVGSGMLFMPLWLENVTGLNPVIRVELNQNFSTPAHITSAVHTELYWEVDAHSNLYSGSAVTVGFPANILREDYITLIHGADISSMAYIPANFSDNSSYWGLTTTSEHGSGLFVLAEMNNPRSDVSSFYFPNTLSARAIDPANRTLRIYGDLSSTDFVFVVFNRVGQIIYETYDLNLLQLTGWDGSDQTGNALSGGSYPYYLKVVENSGNVIEQKGLISIVK